MAEQIVSSADNLAYLAEALGRSPLPDAWRFGPSFEVRLRLRPRLADIDDGELARRLDALGVTGPLRAERLAAVAERRALEPGDLPVGRAWRPRGFGLWRLDDGTGLGVKVYPSSRPAVDLLLAVPPRFLHGFGARSGFPFYKRLADHPQALAELTRLCAALLGTLRRAQPVARVEAAHVQSQDWCTSLGEADRGLVLPEAVAAAAGWAAVARSGEDGWASVSLD